MGENTNDDTGKNKCRGNEKCKCNCNEKNCNCECTCKDSQDKNCNCGNEKCEEYKNDLKRLAAEFDNYKKRVEKEKQQTRMDAQANALAPFLDMNDAFETALLHINKKNATGADANGVKVYEDGIKLLHKKLHSTLQSFGVKEIACKGIANHLYHEVMLQVPGEPAGEIAQILRKGYTMGDYVLRPAQVSVFAGISKEEKSAENKTEKSGGQNEEK
ncbi:MAG: nucleotide exchange factor GrpE [Candidatus Micrarchaeia archaeon]